MQEQIDTGTSSEVVWGEPRTNANDFDMYGSMTDPTTGAVYPAEFSTQDANNLELSLLYLQDSPLASSWIDQAAATGVDVTFDHTIENGLAYDDANGLGVTWNPDIGFQMANGEITSPAGVLVSEFGHTVEPGGLDPNPTPDPVWDNSAEAAAHAPSNEIYADLGEPNRPGYNVEGEFVDVPSVTTHTDTSTYSDTIDTSGLGLSDAGNFDAGSFDAGSFAADYGVADFGYFSGFGGSGTESFGGFDNYGFDAGSFTSDYGIGDYSFDSFGSGGGGSGGGFSADNYLEMMASV